MFVAPFIGSFLGVLARRLPVGDAVGFGRSRCETCRQTLRPIDLLPIASYLALRGRCRYCAAPIDADHLWIELASVGVAAVSLMISPGDAAWAACALGWILLTLAWVDARHMILPDLLTLPLILSGLVWCLIADPEALADHAVGAIMGYLLFRLVEIVYRRLRGRDGLGEGDSKLLAASGAWLGWQGLGLVILLAAVGGLAAAGAARLAGRTIAMDTAIPFGTCLAVATWILFLYQG